MPNVNGKKYPYTKAGIKAAKKAAKKSTPLQEAEVKAVKAGAKAAKLSGTMSKASRNSMQLNKEFNAGYISGKKDIAAVKRNAAKQAMKKMGKKK